MQTLELTIDDVKLEVHYYFEEGSTGDYFEAPIGDTLEVMYVCVEGVDIYDLLSQITLNEIDNKLRDYHNNK